MFSFKIDHFCARRSRKTKRDLLFGRRGRPLALFCLYAQQRRYTAGAGGCRRIAVRRAATHPCAAVAAAAAVVTLRL
jgi:hypothetical protein